MIIYPNARNNPAGAIPVYVVAGAGGKAIPANFLVGATVGPDFGPFPVRVALAGGGGGSNQGVDANAIPVYLSTAANAMPVWDTAPYVPAPPIITTLSFTNGQPSGDIDVVGQMAATNAPSAPGTWAIVSNATMLTLILQAITGQMVITNGMSISAGTYEIEVSATNTDGTDIQTIQIIYDF
jgi:hypothetical protein